MSELLTQSIDRLADRYDLTEEESAAVLAEIMGGEISDVQIAGFLVALRIKGETVEELAGLARTMRALASQVHAEHHDLLDTAGTGGGRRTFNVSTTAALIAAGAGCFVAKHGARSATGISGSADLLEALGARIDLTPEAVAVCIDEVGFGFMYAPSHHPATARVVSVRKELKIRRAQAGSCSVAQTRISCRSWQALWHCSARHTRWLSAARTGLTSCRSPPPRR
jgi:anthranilate phosphoribosyltransferase